MITGDYKPIAIETARVLGMATNILGPQGLPVLLSPPPLPSDFVSSTVLMRFRWAQSVMHRRVFVIFDNRRHSMLSTGA